MSRSVNRRTFLQGTAALAASGLSRRGWGKTGPSERLNIGIIGTSGRALGNIAGVQGENIVAVCDIDDKLLGVAKERFPGARTYTDFRRLLDSEGIDAVVISTADHTHAPAAAAALRLGKHVYCEKPLTHSVYEARTVAGLAAKAKVATQMGTQIHAGDNYRRVVELIRAGAIGPVREVHVWCGKTWSGGDRPEDTPTVPPTLHWDLWIGPAPKRPYNPAYLPKNWRRWWDFGGGTLGDMACHYMDLPFWALDLRYPKSIETEGPPVRAETTPAWLIVRYQFPARGEQPPVALTWYDGGKRPELLAEKKAPEIGDGVLFVGEKGMLLANYSKRWLLPEETFRDYKAPEPSIPRSIGHHAEWIRACKEGTPTTCNFDYSGALTEAVLLGNVAYRVGKKLAWNAEKLAAEGCSEAEQYLRREYRPGWTL